METIDIPIINDDALECIEFFYLQLITPLDFVEFTTNNATVTILSDDGEMIIVVYKSLLCILMFSNSYYICDQHYGSDMTLR